MDQLVRPRPAARPRTSDKAPSARHWRCARETVLLPPENKQEGRKEGREALARRRPNNGGWARGGLSGVCQCHVQQRVAASGRNSPVALLSLLSGSSLCPSDAVQSGTQIYEQRTAVKQSGKREWQAGRGSRHDRTDAGDKDIIVVIEGAQQAAAATGPDGEIARIKRCRGDTDPSNAIVHRRDEIAQFCVGRAVVTCSHFQSICVAS